MIAADKMGRKQPPKDRMPLRYAGLCPDDATVLNMSISRPNREQRTDT